MRAMLTHNRWPRNALRSYASTGIATLESVRQVRRGRVPERVPGGGMLQGLRPV